MATREQIYQAAFDRVAKLTGFATASRKIKLFADVLEGECPAVFMLQKPERFESTAGGGRKLMKRVFQVDFYIYTWAKGADVPSALLNPLIDAVEAAFSPENVVSGNQTLGGLVENARIEGQIIIDAGDLDGQGLAVIPLTIVVP